MFWRKKKQQQQTPPQPSSTPKLASKAPGAARPKLSLLFLESRLMFDAAAAATAAEVNQEQVAQEQAESAVSAEGGGEPTAAEQEAQDLLQALAGYSPGASTTEVVFVDPTVPNYQELLSGLDPNIEVIMLDGGQDGIQQIASSLAGRTGIDAVHLISHGDAGTVQLGTGTLTAESMSGQYADELATIQQALSVEGDILVYGCDFAEGEVGREAVTLLSQLTGADVAASDDRTGHATLEGDWDLEYQVGVIETDVAIDAIIRGAWSGALDVNVTFQQGTDGYDGTEDTEVRQGAPTTSYGNTTTINADLNNGSGVAQGLIQFDNIFGYGPGQIPPGSTINSATLTVQVFDTSNSGTQIALHRMLTGWDESTTWNSLTGGVSSDGVEATVAPDATVDAANQTGARVFTGLKDALQAWSNGEANHGWAILTNSTNGWDFYSSEYGVVGQRPSLTIDYTPANAAPTDLSLSSNSVAENASTGTVVGTVSGTDPDSGDTKSYSLTDTAGGRFAIDSATGVITVADGSLLNYESATSHSVTVRVTDSGGLTYDETFTINLTNVNEGPTGADATVTFTEDTAQALTPANFGFSDVDAGDSLSAVRIDTLPGAGTLALAGVAVTAGQVVSVADLTAGNLVFTPATNATGTGYANLTFSVRDSNNAYDTAPNTLAFNLTAVNDAPTDLSLSANSVAENATTGTVVGTISGTDVDAGDTKTYSLTDTAGGRFAIDPGTGVITVADGSLLNYESAASHNLTVQVTDSSGQSYDETFTINLTNVNEGPTDLALSANSVAENATTGTVVGTVSGTDPDAGDIKTYSLTDTAGGRFAINSATGQLTVADGSLLNYEAATSHTLTVRVTDSGGQSYTETFTINLTNVNEAQAGTESTDALIEDMAHTLATTTFRPHDTYGAPKTSASDPLVANGSEASGFPLANTSQNMGEITTETPSTEIILTAERTHLSVASEEPIGNGVNSKEPQQSSPQDEQHGSDVPADQTNVHRSATAETERKDFLEPDDAIDPIESTDTSTILKQTATTVLASVALQNGLGTNTKLKRLFSHPAGASNVSPNPTPQQSSDDNGASDQNGAELSRSTAEDADQAGP